MTKNSPKFVEVVGAILITAGFLVLGKLPTIKNQIKIKKIKIIKIKLSIIKRYIFCSLLF